MDEVALYVGRVMVRAFMVSDWAIPVLCVFSALASATVAWVFTWRRSARRCMVLQAGRWIGSEKEAVRMAEAARRAWRRTWRGKNGPTNREIERYMRALSEEFGKLAEEQRREESEEA